MNVTAEVQLAGCCSLSGTPYYVLDVAVNGNTLTLRASHYEYHNLLATLTGDNAAPHNHSLMTDYFQAIAAAINKTQRASDAHPDIHDL